VPYHPRRQRTSRLHLAALAACAALTAPSPAADITSTWIPYSAGNWSDPALWDNNPAADTYPDNGNLENTYDAIVDTTGGAALIYLDRDITVRDLTLTGSPILRSSSAFDYHPPGTNTLTVNRNFTFNGGDATIKIRVAPAATALVTSLNVDKTLGALYVAGNMSFADTTDGYFLQAGAASRLEIETAGTLAITRPLTLATYGPPTFSFGTFLNNGLVTQSAGADFVNNWDFFNAGTFRANAPVSASHITSTGLLDLQSAAAVLTFDQSPSTLSGALRLAPGSVLTLAGAQPNAPHQFGPLAATNAGTINIRGSTRVFDTTTISGVVNFQAIFNGEKLILDADLALSGPATLDNHNVSGPGRLIATNLTWKGGNLNGAELNVPAGGTFTLPSASAISLSNAARITIDGNVEWAGHSFSAGGTGISRFEIHRAGVVRVHPSSFAGFSGFASTHRATLDNAGLFDLDHVNFSINGDWSLVSSGTIRASGGTFSASAHSIDISGLLDFRQGVDAALGSPFQANPFTITPSGVWSLATSARATVYAPLTNAGTIELADTSTLSFDSFVLVEPTFVNAGTFRANAGAAFDIPSVVNIGTLDFLTGRNHTIRLSQPAPNAFLHIAGSTAIQIANSGPVTNQGRVLIESGGALTTSDFTSFVNFGTVRVAAGGSAAFGRFTNAGALQLDGPAANVFFDGLTNLSGATIRIASSAVASIDGVANAGTFEVSGPGVQANVSVSIINDGTCRADAGAIVTSGALFNHGNLEIDNAQAIFATSNSSNRGSILIQNGARFVFRGALRNSGTIRALASATAAFAFLDNVATARFEGPGTTVSFTNLANLSGATLRVAASAVATFKPTGTLPFSNRGTLELDTGARFFDVSSLNNSGTIRAAAASILTIGGPTPHTNTGVIDLNSGAAVVVFPQGAGTAPTLTAVRNQIIAGYANGAWNGTGITSTNALNDPSTAVGYSTASNLASATLAWLGVASNSGAVIARHTKSGDANLDGVVNFNDLVVLAQNYNTATPNQPWSGGDFTYDGQVTFADLVALAQNYNTSLPGTPIPGTPIPGASTDFPADLANAFATVPEPAILPGLTLAAATLARRRPRRVHPRAGGAARSLH
jgi:hypothetical protein